MANDNYLFVLISENDSTRIDESTILAMGLPKMGAKSSTLLFIGSAIQALDKKDPRSLIISKKLNDLKAAGVKIIACPVAMAYYNVEKEDLIYYDDIIPGGKVIAEANKAGDAVLTI